jgi:tagaturonate epimerase
MRLPKYSMGIGDRFAHQGIAQLGGFVEAKREGMVIAPVWNKSNREHTIIGSRPGDVRREADSAVQACGWADSYFVDADHINAKTVDGFLESSDFFTLDVAEQIGLDPGAENLAKFVARHKSLVGRLEIPGIKRPLEITETLVAGAARKFLAAVEEAGRIYRRIEAAKGAANVVIEVSMDETDQPQTPAEFLVILAAVADEAIPAQTLAPRFTGRFNKGVDYVGNVDQFEKEFREDLAVIVFAVREFGLPDNLKLSIHSGSDKFSLYPRIHRALKEFDAGVHLKTAGTTWLEELTGLALAGGDGLEIAKEIYRSALEQLDELCAPYASVIDIHRASLPFVAVVNSWDGAAFAAALRHDQKCREYSPSMRQLIHVAYKLAAAMGNRFTDALNKHETIIAAGVAENIYKRHVRPLFFGDGK